MWQLVFQEQENPKSKVAQEFSLIDFWIICKHLTGMAWIQADKLWLEPVPATLLKVSEQALTIRLVELNYIAPY